MNAFVRLITVIVYVEFVALLGFLVFLWLRTRSKGLIILLAAGLMKFEVLTYIIVFTYRNLSDTQWEPGLDIRDVELTRALDLSIISRGIEAVLCYSLCLLGAFIIYKEWRRGDLRPRQLFFLRTHSE